MSLIPIATAFVVALVGATAIGLRPGYSFGTLLTGATMVAAVTGIVATVLEFLARHHFVPAAIVVGTIAGLLVAPLLGITQTLGIGDTRDPVIVVWPIATVAGLLFSRAAGMQLPALRRRPRMER